MTSPQAGISSDLTCRRRGSSCFNPPFFFNFFVYHVGKARDVVRKIVGSLNFLLRSVPFSISISFAQFSLLWFHFLPTQIYLIYFIWSIVLSSYSLHLSQRQSPYKQIPPRCQSSSPILNHASSFTALRDETCQARLPQIKLASDMTGHDLRETCTAPLLALALASPRQREDLEVFAQPAVYAGKKGI